MTTTLFGIVPDTLDNSSELYCIVTPSACLCSNVAEKNIDETFIRFDTYTIQSTCDEREKQHVTDNSGQN